MILGGCEVKIIHSDITEIAVDAIVNAANNKLLMGGGVAGDIKRKGGPQIETEAVEKGPIDIGGAVATSAGKLKARYVIHAATMGMDHKTDEIKVRNSCASALKVADELKISSIAFPALGCGVGGFPLKASAKIMAQEVKCFSDYPNYHTLVSHFKPFFKVLSQFNLLPETIHEKLFESSEK